VSCSGWRAVSYSGVARPVDAQRPSASKAAPAWSHGVACISSRDVARLGSPCRCSDQICRHGQCARSPCSFADALMSRGQPQRRSSLNPRRGAKQQLACFASKPPALQAEVLLPSLARAIRVDAVVTSVGTDIAPIGDAGPLPVIYTARTNEAMHVQNALLGSVHRRALSLELGSKRQRSTLRGQPILRPRPTRSHNFTSHFEQCLGGPCRCSDRICRHGRCAPRRCGAVVVLKQLRRRLQIKHF